MNTDEHRFLRKVFLIRWAKPGIFVIPSYLCLSVFICGKRITLDFNTLKGAEIQRD